MPVVLAFNKIDDLNEEERATLDYLTWVYRDIGYEVLHLSAATGEGLPELAPYLRDRITLLAGHSGVGKSTLLNRLIPRRVCAHRRDLRVARHRHAHHHFQPTPRLARRR